MSTGDVGSSSSAETVSTEERKEKKRLWDIILTATPVLLTVLATALASFSNKEMTKAQYFRSTAAQNQSKVGDQWAFFQAKRVRTTVQQQRADRGAFDETHTRALSDRLPAALKRLDGEAEAIFSKLDGELAPLKPSLEELRKAIAKAAKEIEATTQAIVTKLDNPEVKHELDFLTNEPLPLPKDADPNASPKKLVRDAVIAVEAMNNVKPIKQGTKELNPSIEKAIASIDGRKPRADYEAEVRAIKGDVLRQAIEAAEAEAKRYDDAAKPSARLFEELHKLLTKQKEILRPVGRVALKVNEAVDLLPRSALKNAPSASNDVLNISSRADRLDLSTRELAESLSNARADFDARRLEREARFNQEIAGLYEVDVSREGFLADECMARKDIYMYGMLVAQAGVMIATFGLAVRLRGLLWALAALAGLAAVVMLGMGLGVMTYMGMQG